MFTLLSQRFRDRSGQLSRRTLLQAGALAVPLALAQAAAGRAETRSTGLGRARSLIYIFNFGGPSQLETFDLKPDAPDNIRGEFRPISTSVPGTRVVEHLPRLAALAHKYAIIRSMSHRDIEHQTGGYTGLTGHRHPSPRIFAPPTPSDHPPIGSVVSRLRPPARAVPNFVTMPTVLFDAVVIPGQGAGWLGRSHDPLVIRQDPNAATFAVPDFVPAAGLDQTRYHHRRQLLDQVDRATELSQAPPIRDGFAPYYGTGFRLLASTATHSAFNLQREPAHIRERYGRTIFGQCCLLARRLVEAGVPVVSIYFCAGGLTGLEASRPWDTHQNNFRRMRGDLLPITDQAVSALLEDLEQRGLLAETVVAWTGEFGRTPRVGARSSPNGAAVDGRDHWPYCFSTMLAGGGIGGGRIHGASDRNAGEPAESPVSPADFMATIYHCLGISPRTEIHDMLGRPVRICEGTPIGTLL